MDHSKLPQTARDLIEAAEIEAQSIFDTCIKDCSSLREQAYESGFDPFDIGFSPGRPALEAARALAKECPIRAAGHLFHATALVYWQYVLKPDVTIFVTNLETIWQSAHQRFGLNFKMPEEVKRNWRVWALRERAAHSSTKPELPRAGPRATPAPRRGYRGEVREWMKRKELKSVADAAKRLGVGPDTLKSIMSSKGRKRYADDTLADVLRQISKK